MRLLHKPSAGTLEPIPRLIRAVRGDLKLDDLQRPVADGARPANVTLARVPRGGVGKLGRRPVVDGIDEALPLALVDIDDAHRVTAQWQR
jgi:hypothetical protein